jgi:hypothetical protein
MSYQAEKQVVRDYYAALDSTSGADMLNAVGAVCCVRITFGAGIIRLVK